MKIKLSQLQMMLPSMVGVHSQNFTVGPAQGSLKLPKNPRYTLILRHTQHGTKGKRHAKPRMVFFFILQTLTISKKRRRKKHHKTEQ